ncbi:unnamed protein product [Closterium sp. Naga37s-1]|nr:unnamed protein product [Closterium sp. Naga37s-1]
MDSPSSEPALASDSSTSAEDVEEVEIEEVDEPRRADFQEKGVASMFVDADRVVLVTSNIEADSCYSVVHQGPILLSPPLSDPLPPTPISGSGVYGVASMFVDADRVVLVTSNIEAERITAEELAGLGSIQVFAKPWFWDDSAHLNRLMTLGRGFKPEADTGDILTPIFSELRATLTPFEVGKYRVLARQCGELLGEVARGLRRGMTEKEVAGAVAGACYARGIHPILLLVGADERMDKWRHPLPTSNVAKSRLLITLSGRRHGLIASLSRVIHFGPLPADSPLRYKHTAVTYVDSVAIASTRVGATSDAIMASIQRAYEERGFRDEWLHQHQGGATGYRTREWKAEPGVRYYVGSPQAFAWNPSIAGTRSEDTILVGGGGEEGGGVGDGGGDGGMEGACPEVLTATPDWPMIRHVVDGIEIMRPDVLEILD